MTPFWTDLSINDTVVGNRELTSSGFPDETAARNAFIPVRSRLRFWRFITLRRSDCLARFSADL
jgi:hypothetical protein